MFGRTVQIMAFTLSNLLLLIKRRMSLNVESSKMFNYQSFDNIYLVFIIDCVISISEYLPSKSRQALRGF